MSRNKFPFLSIVLALALFTLSCSKDSEAAYSYDESGQCTASVSVSHEDFMTKAVGNGWAVSEAKVINIDGSLSKPEFPTMKFGDCFLNDSFLRAYIHGNKLKPDGHIDNHYDFIDSSIRVFPGYTIGIVSVTSSYLTVIMPEFEDTGHRMLSGLVTFRKMTQEELDHYNKYYGWTGPF